MTLRKAIVRYKDESRKEMETIYVDMHPLEEAAFLLDQEILTERAALPQLPSSDELVKLMLDEGQEVARQHVANIELARKNGEEALAPKIAAVNEKHAAWNEHCKKCEELKVDKNTYEKEKHNGKV